MPEEDSLHLTIDDGSETSIPTDIFDNPNLTLAEIGGIVLFKAVVEDKLTFGHQKIIDNGELLKGLLRKKIVNIDVSTGKINIALDLNMAVYGEEAKNEEG